MTAGRPGRVYELLSHPTLPDVVTLIALQQVFVLDNHDRIEDDLRTSVVVLLLLLPLLQLLCAV